MCIEENDWYSFHADLLVATEPPLYLEPVDNPQDAGRLLDLLSDPRYQELPPSPKTRKKTTAEVAADDAQRQETERRMLIIDERIKPAGTGAAQNDNQTAPSSLTFSRFKTIEMVRQNFRKPNLEACTVAPVLANRVADRLDYECTLVCHLSHSPLRTRAVSPT